MLLIDYLERTDRTGYHFNTEYTIQGKPVYRFSALEVSKYEYVYGYRAISKLVQAICTSNFNSVLMHGIYEHKTLMLKRLKFIQEQFKLDLTESIAEYEKIEKQSLIVRNKHLKFQMTRNNESSLLLKANEIENAEARVLLQIISKLENNIV